MTEEGTLIAGRYRLIARLGTGAMGVVWQAHDERLHRTVAVKQLLAPAGMDQAQAEEATRRAMREARLAARLHHPCAITVYDVAEHADRPCLIMEYVPAQSLSTVLATRGALLPEDVAGIGSQIAAALAAAHEVGVVHRDVKPGNVLLADDGTAKITDFGISRAVGDATVTATGILAGTPAYLAPEVAQGEDATFAADVFSLGSTLYTAVEAVPPFGLDDNPMALLHRIATSEITPPEQAGPLAPVLTRMLHRDPSQRPTMQQVQEALTTVADAPEPAPAPPVLVPATPALPVPEPSPTVTASADSAPASGVAADARPRPAPPRRAAAALAGVAAIVGLAASLIVAGLILVATLVSDGTPTAGSAADPTPAPALAPTAQDAVQDPPSPSPSPDPSPPPAPSPEADTPPPPAPNPTPDAPGPQDSAAKLQAAVTDYYALMPADLEAGWPRMTSDYQRNHAGGFEGYQAFWGPIQRVQISNVSATPPDSVTATLTYFYQDGRIIEERTGFGLAAEDGIWKIASSTVFSSQSRQS